MFADQLLMGSEPANCVIIDSAIELGLRRLKLCIRYSGRKSVAQM